MPNYVTIEFTVNGEPAAVEAFRAAVHHTYTEEEIKKHEEQNEALIKRWPEAPVRPLQPWVFDFNRIIPMPEQLMEAEEGSVSDLGYRILNQTLSLPGHSWLKDKGIKSLPEYVMYLIEQTPNILSKGYAQYNNILETGYGSWYGWSIDNWGTKWNSGDSEIVDQAADGTWIKYRFQTAWSMPVPIFEAIAEQFPDITIEGAMDEEGGFFYGSFSVADGVYRDEREEGVRKNGPYWHPEYEDETFYVVPPDLNILTTVSVVSKEGVETVDLTKLAKGTVDKYVSDLFERIQVEPEPAL